MTPTDSQAASLHDELARVLALLENATPGVMIVTRGTKYSHLKNDAGDYVMEGGLRGTVRTHADASAIAAAINFLRKHGAHIAETFKETPNG